MKMDEMQSLMRLLDRMRAKVTGRSMAPST